MGNDSLNCIHNTLIMQLVIKDKLPTRAHLRTWGSIYADSCCLRNSSLETRDYLFFTCSFSAQIWSRFLQLTTSRTHARDRHEQLATTARKGNV